MRTFSQLVSDLSRGAAVEEAQARNGRSYFGRYRRPAAAAVIDWNRPGPELGALVRGLQFGPYPNPLGSPKILLNDAAYIVTEARPAQTKRRPASAGKVIDANGQYVCVATGDGATLELTGLSDLRGQAVDIGQLKLRPDARLAVLPPDAVERLGDLDAIMCRSEAFWLDRLSTLTPVAAPLSSSPTEKSGSAGHVRRRLQLPLDLAGKFPPGVMEVTLLAVVLARVERQSQFDLALTDTHWSKRIRGLERIVAEESCLRIQIEPERNFAALVQAIGSELERVRERGTWLHDLYARQPTLRMASAAAGTARLPVGVALVESTDTWKPITPRALTLVCSTDRSAPVLVGDARQFSGEAFETLARLYESLAAAVSAARPDHTLFGLPLLDPDTFQHVVHDWNRTEMSYPTSSCIHAEIEVQARRTPDRTALVFEDTQLSYRSLNERANQLAARLIDLGVGPERLAAMHVARSLDMVVATARAQGGGYAARSRFPGDASATH
jgi:hypothetical protein